MTRLPSEPAGFEDSPPKAQQIPFTLECHGHVRQDDYYWMRDRGNPEVLAYLEAENSYAETSRRPTRQLEKTLFEEMTGRIQPTDLSVP